MSGPIAAAERIAAIDVLRGFALLGILLLNILGFGLISTAYFDPLAAQGPDEFSRSLNLGIWATVDVLFEGSMRCLFSMLFGAGVVLFLGGGRSAKVHYRRTAWLLVFGLFDAFVLLWNGDILVVYALCGMLLYWVRDTSPARLLVSAGALLLLMAVMGVTINYGLGEAKRAADQIAQLKSSGQGATIDPELVSLADEWHDFVLESDLPEDVARQELSARRDSYSSAFWWNVDEYLEVLSVALPTFLVWDALMMMLVGMALFQLGVLTGSRSVGFYGRLAGLGFLLGLSVNGFEVYRLGWSDVDLRGQFSLFEPTYHIGRLGMGLGYLGLIMLICKLDWLPLLRRGLGAVGRMALTNYLMQSAICLLLFTGAGFALVDEFQRWQLYGVVFGIWIVQWLFSLWWLEQFQFGPMEWLWRSLTYGKPAPLRRS